jgi:MFS transporter, NNP family, nitrate/nitrite transporter
MFLALGLALGLVGASFAVGTPYVARFCPRNRGFAMGVFGAGTSGAAINMFVAPVLVSHYGWHSVPCVYAVLLLVTEVVFRFLALPDPAVGGPGIPLRKQIAALRDPRVWKYCQYYSVVFGGFTALSVWMPQYFVNQYHFPIAQAALMTACFSLPGGVLRAAGGWLSDKFGAHAVTWWVLWAAWIALFVLSHPQTDLVVQTIRGPVSFHISLSSSAFTGLMFCPGVSFACGMASTFKYIAEDFADNMGAVSGIVGLAGGLGGFLLPILWGDPAGCHRRLLKLFHAALWHYLGVTHPGVYDRGPSDTNQWRENRGNELTGSG